MSLIVSLSCSIIMSFNFLNDKFDYKNGIYYSVKTDTISYPDEGNQNSFQLEENSFWFNHRNNLLISIINKFCKNKVFFDVGGGNGFVSKGVQDSGMETVLIEPGIEGCLNAQKRGVNNIICSTLSGVGFAQDSLDAVGLFDVVEHIEDDLSFLKDCNQFLKPEGYIFITVPAYNLLWSHDDIYAGHFKRYTLNSLQSLLEKSGFKIIYKTYIFSFLPLPIFLSRTLPSKIRKYRPIELSKSQGEHNKKGLQSKILNFFLKKELQKIINLEMIPFGSTCLIVAQKNSNN